MFAHAISESPSDVTAVTTVFLSHGPRTVIWMLGLAPVVFAVELPDSTVTLVWFFSTVPDLMPAAAAALAVTAEVRRYAWAVVGLATSVFEITCPPSGESGCPR